MLNTKDIYISPTRTGWLGSETTIINPPKVPLINLLELINNEQPGTSIDKKDLQKSLTHLARNLKPNPVTLTQLAQAADGWHAPATYMSTTSILIIILLIVGTIILLIRRRRNIQRLSHKDVPIIRTRASATRTQQASGGGEFSGHQR